MPGMMAEASQKQDRQTHAKVGPGSMTSRQAHKVIAKLPMGPPHSCRPKDVGLERTTNEQETCQRNVIRTLNTPDTSA